MQDADTALTLALLCFSYWWLVMEQLVSVLMILTMQAGVGVELCGAHQQGVSGNLIYKTDRNSNDQKLFCWIFTWPEMRKRLQPQNCFLITTITISYRQVRSEKGLWIETVRSRWGNRSSRAATGVLAAQIVILLWEKEAGMTYTISFCLLT